MNTDNNGCSILPSNNNTGFLEKKIVLDLHFITMFLLFLHQLKWQVK